MSVGVELTFRESLLLLTCVKESVDFFKENLDLEAINGDLKDVEGLAFRAFMVEKLILTIRAFPPIEEEDESVTVFFEENNFEPLWMVFHWVFQKHKKKIEYMGDLDMAWAILEKFKPLGKGK